LALVVLVGLATLLVVMGLILYFHLLHQPEAVAVVEMHQGVVQPPVTQAALVVVVVQQPGLAALEILH
jgi:hypothetical protein